jgi:hypothetical protein
MATAPAAPAGSPPHLAAAKRLFELLAKSDGRDKFLATLQYLALYASAGEAGAALTKVAGNLGSSRKPFRVLKVRAPLQATGLGLMRGNKLGAGERRLQQPRACTTMVSATIPRC